MAYLMLRRFQQMLEFHDSPLIEKDRIEKMKRLNDGRATGIEVDKTCDFMTIGDRM